MGNAGMSPAQKNARNAPIIEETRKTKLRRQRPNLPYHGRLCFTFLFQGGFNLNEAKYVV
jgi:hypothetical protein